MYFQNFLKGRSTNPNINLQSSNTQQNISQNNPKFIPLRPPPPQNNYPHSKPQIYQQHRNQPYRPNSSAHIYINPSKNTSINNRQPICNNFPSKLETGSTVGITGGAPFSRHQIPEAEKYICHSPAKVENRASAGLPYEENPYSRFQYRRSQSINELKPNQFLRQSTINHEPNNHRFDYKTYAETRNQMISPPLTLKFNNTSIVRDDKGTLPRKQSAEGLMLTHRQGRSQNLILKEPISQHKNRNSYNNIPYLSTKFDLNFSKFQNNSLNREPQNSKKLDHQQGYLEKDTKKVDLSKTFDEVYKNSNASTLKTSQNPQKDSSRQFQRKYSNPKIIELDKTLDQDIETLKYTNRYSDQIVNRQLNKNSYLNQLFEQKGLRLNAEDKVVQNKDNLKEKKELAAKNIHFQREIEEKNKEVTEKNKQILEKNRQLLEKNKEISQKDLEIAEKNKEIAQRIQQISEKSTIISDKSKQIIEKNKEISQKNKDIFQKNKELSQKSKLMVEKSKLIESMANQISQLKQQFSQKQIFFSQYQQEYKKLEKCLKAQVKIKSDQCTIYQQKIIKYQKELSQKSLQTKGSDQIRKKLQQNIIDLKSEILYYKEEYQNKSSIQATNQTIYKQLQSSLEQIKTLKTSIKKLESQNQSNRQKLNIMQKQNEAQKLRLIQFHQKELKEYELKLQICHNRIQQLQENIRNSQLLIKQTIDHGGQLSNQLQSYRKIQGSFKGSYDSLKSQYEQIAILLLKGEPIEHEKVIQKVKSSIQNPSKQQIPQVKQNIRPIDANIKLQQQLLQRRHQQLSRQLKKLSCRLAGAGIEVQQGGKLLKDANNQIILLHMLHLNQKYRQQNQDQ